LAASKFCVVFEEELARVWPAEKAESGGRDAVIEAFAKSNNLSVAIHDPGISVIFSKLNDPSHQSPL
jgi:hypothetical protein